MRYGQGTACWSVSAQGVGIDGATPVGTAGPPETVRRVWGWFEGAIDTASHVFAVPPKLLVALICNEAAGGQPNYGLVCTARREEPGYRCDTATPDRISVGCCQTLLSTAREVLHRPSLRSADLANPGLSIAAAAAYIHSHAPATKLDPVLTAAAYNAGSLRPSPANRWGLVCTGDYIDRFVSWYNDACRMDIGL